MRATRQIAPSATAVPATEHRNGGRALESSERARFEDAFQHDFSRVRVHSDRDAASSAAALDAASYTRGDHIYFSGSAATTRDRTQLLAHELAHITQQAIPRTSPEATVDLEADQAASAAMSGKRASIRQGASRDAAHFRRVAYKGGQYEIGDVTLNPAAQSDVLNEHALLPGPDQPHLIVNNRQLGYDVEHKTPDDPFRWERLKEIIDRGHVIIQGVSTTTTFDVKEVRGKSTQIVQKNLLQLRGAGIALVRESVLRTIGIDRPMVIASPDDAHDMIIYEQRSGSALLSNALAHELYGHLWLSMQGVPQAHGREITPEQAQTGNVRDPFGSTYSGEVDTYIGEFAGASESGLESPTQHVSEAFLNDSLVGVEREALAPAGLTRQQGSWKASPGFIRQWALLSNNYGILRATVPARAGTVAMKVLSIARQLDEDQRFAFDAFLSEIQLTFIHHRGRGELAKDIQGILRASQREVPPPTGGVK